MASPISDDTVKLTLEQVKARRPQELIYLLTQRMIRKFYTDLDGNKLFHLFKQVKAVVEEWYETQSCLHGNGIQKHALLRRRGYDLRSHQ